MAINRPNVFNVVGDAKFSNTAGTPVETYSQAIAGADITLNPTSGKGNVTVNSDVEFGGFSQTMTGSNVGDYGAEGCIFLTDIISSLTLTAGNVYALKDNGSGSPTWVNATHSDFDRLLAVCPDDVTNGSKMLIEGTVVSGDTSGGVIGNPVYLADTTPGWTLTKPTTEGDDVRVIGYILNLDATKGRILFDPSHASYKVL